MNVVSIALGSSSDWETLKPASDILAQFGVPHDVRVLSAHRMPDDLFSFAESAAR
ncbi:MAG TPA: AIR carboxylase family protein, partial [Rubrivivax sp.]